MSFNPLKELIGWCFYYTVTRVVPAVLFVILLAFIIVLVVFLIYLGMQWEQSGFDTRSFVNRLANPSPKIYRFPNYFGN